MRYELEEGISNPDLFVGRKEEQEFFLKWTREEKKMTDKARGKKPDFCKKK
jgi:hypothetical protein